MRYLGPVEKRAGSSAPGRKSAASEHENVSQIPQIAQVLGVPVRKMSEKTRALYEYAQSVLQPEARVAQKGS